MSKKLLKHRARLLKKFIKLRRDLRQLWYQLKVRLKLLQKWILQGLPKHSNNLFIERKVKQQLKMWHQSIKLRGQILEEISLIKEDLWLLGYLMTNKIKILIYVRLKNKKQVKMLNKMKIKDVADKTHKNKKVKMKLKTKIIRNRYKVIKIRIIKMTYLKI